MASASASPSVSPSESPSASPSVSPSVSPSKSPSVSPSASPSYMPAGEVTYTQHGNTFRIGRLRLTFFQISFGGSNDSYPSGGIPLTTAKMGFSDEPKAVIVLESNVSGHEFEWDRSANTLRMTTSFGTEETAGQTLTAHTLECMCIGW